jgi:hypothetical protein
MEKLAKELAARGKALKDPYKYHIEKAAEAGVPFEDLEEAEDHSDNEEYKSEGTAHTDTEESKQQVSFATTAKVPPKKASFASPSSAMKKSPPPRKLAAITGAIRAPIANGIAALILFAVNSCQDVQKLERDSITIGEVPLIATFSITRRGGARYSAISKILLKNSLNS